tara:strand:- start:3091 stop:3306 length:216 start_codon:yes stop_codon:yes gene_type:complete
MNEVVNEYSNDEVIVVWDSVKCKHAAECVKNSPDIFNAKNKPWIDLSKGESDEIMATIDKCPSGALSYRKR